MTPSRWRLAWFAAVAFVALFGAGEFASWALGAATGFNWWATDLRIVLEAGVRLGEGRPVYEDPRFLYPPLAGVVALPLRGVEPFAVSLAYAAAKLALAVAGVAWVTRGRATPDRMLAIVALVASLPFLHDLFLGNANLLIVAGAFVAAYGAPRVRSGVALGLVAAVFAKPLIVPILLWLLVRRRPVLAGTVIGGLAATAVGLALAGPAAYVDWVRALVQGGRYAAPFAGNHGVTAVAPDLWLPVAAAIAAGLLFVLVRRGPAAGLTWASVSGILIAPYAGTYSALPIALAIPAFGPSMPGLALAVVALSPVATGHLLPVYAALILLAVLRLREPAQA